MAKRKTDLTQEDILAWADNLDSIPTVVTAKRQGVSVEAVRRRRIKCAAFIAEKFDINEYRLPLYGLYGLFLNSVITNLRKCDSRMTIAYGKGMNIWVEKQIIEEANPTGSMTNDELTRRISRIVGAPIEVQKRTA